MSSGLILYSKEDGIGTVRFNRPERMNAASYEMLYEMEEFLDEASLDDEVRVIVITGNGRAFCAGTDLSNLGSDFSERNSQRVRYQPKRDRSAYPTWTFVSVPKPTIAAINGAAVGMGADFTIQCDFRIAADVARIGFVFSRRAIVPDTGAGTYLLPQIVGISKALELVYSGEIIDAAEALRIGLVNQVVPADKLEEATKEFAKRLMEGAPLSQKWSKELIYRSLERDSATHLTENSRLMAAATKTEDHVEGVKSFLEKRKPIWRGR